MIGAKKSQGATQDKIRGYRPNRCRLKNKGRKSKANKSDNEFKGVDPFARNLSREVGKERSREGKDKVGPKG